MSVCARMYVDGVVIDEAEGDVCEARGGGNYNQVTNEKQLTKTKLVNVMHEIKTIFLRYLEVQEEQEKRQYQKQIERQLAVILYT